MSSARVRAATSSVSNNTSVPNIDFVLNRASLLAESGRFQEAAAICQGVLQRVPRHAKALNLFGIISFQSGNTKAAIDILRQAVASDPRNIDCHNNLGVILRELGRIPEAIISFRKALAINSRHVDTLINCGNALQDVGQLREAVNLYRQVLSIASNHLGALNNLANALQELGCHEDAAATYEQLLAMAPDYDYAFGSSLFSKMHCCNWSSWDADVKRLISAIEEGRRVSKPFDLLAILDSPHLQLACARVFSQDKYPSSGRVIDQYQRDGRKIRVAYLSADFRQHPVAQLLVGLIEKHDRTQFDVWGYTFTEDDGSVLSSRIRQAFDRLVDVRRMSDAEVAELLRKEKIDIAIDLMGYTTNARMGIFAERAAPIQIGFLGYAGTTGASYFDYLIADSFVIPPDATRYYSEKVLYLPDVFQPNDNLLPESQNAPNVGRSKQGLPENAVVFCAFNNHYKITPVAFALWMRLLSQVENSVLWLSQCNDVAKANLCKEASKFNIQSERLVFARREPNWQDHIARHSLADLFLDTWPYNAHTTASDALRAGLPVLTYAGASYASRVAATLLRAVGLSELVTESPEDYVTMAIRLAQDSGARQELRSKLRKELQKTTLFDGHRYRQNFEKVLQDILV
jgi:protein O-GlcNAc transferase